MFTGGGACKGEGQRVRGERVRGERLRGERGDIASKSVKPHTKKLATFRLQKKMSSGVVFFLSGRVY